jgi:hypothetical protein
MSSSSRLNIESAQRTQSTMWDASAPAVNDFSWGRQSSLSLGSRSKCLRVVCASCSNSLISESIIFIVLCPFLRWRMDLSVSLSQLRQDLYLQVERGEAKSTGSGSFFGSIIQRLPRLRPQSRIDA